MRVQNGYTLIEVVISMLLTAVMVSSVMSVALTAKRGEARNERKLVANQASRQLTASLKNYVTADSATTTISGPGTGTNKWGMTSAAGSGQVKDDCGSGVSCAANSCYALQAGSHTLCGFLPSWFEAAPYSAKIIYFVSYPGGASSPPQVNLTVDWTEP